MGLIMGALGGMADAGMKILDERSKNEEAERVRVAEDERQRKRMELENSMLLTREKEVAKFRQDLEISGIDLKTTATTNAALKNAPNAAKAQGIIASEANRIDLEKKVNEAKNPDLRQAKIDDATAEEQAKLNFYKKNAPELLKQAQDLARAKHVEGIGSIITARLANMSIDEKIETKKLFDSYIAETDPTKKATKRQEMLDRGLIKDESSTEKVTDYKLDPTTGEVTQKTERTVKQRGTGGGDKPSSTDVAVKYDASGNAYVRGPDGKPVLRDAKPAKPTETPKPESGPKPGDTRTVSNGPRQGYKTQVYKATGRSGSNMTWVDQ